MSFAPKICTVVLIVVASCILVENRSYNNGLIFYDLTTKQVFLPPTVSVSRGRSLSNFKFSSKGSIWSTFGKPCDCAGPLCGCCVGIKVKQYNFDQKMCANVTYVGPKNELNLEMFVNETQSAKYAVSARNPSPFCIPVMLGIPMSMCVQMSDVGLQGDNMHACMDFMVQLASTQIFEMHFQCMQLGAQGAQWVLPGGGGSVIPPSQSKITDRNDEDYGTSDEYYDEEEEKEDKVEKENVINEENAEKNELEDKENEEENENKAEEEVDYNDLAQENDKKSSKENEVVTDEEKREENIKLTNVGIAAMLRPKPKSEEEEEESAETETFDMLTKNDSQMSTENTPNENLSVSNIGNDSNAKSEETLEQTTELANDFPTPMANVTIENKLADNINDSVMSITSSSSSEAPIVILPETTTTTASPLTGPLNSTSITKTEESNSAHNESDYDNEESGEEKEKEDDEIDEDEDDDDDDDADEEEEDEDDEEDDDESTTSEVKEPENAIIEQKLTTTTDDNNKNIIVATTTKPDEEKSTDEEEKGDEEEDDDDEDDADDYEEEYDESATDAPANDNNPKSGLDAATSTSTTPATSHQQIIATNQTLSLTTNGIVEKSDNEMNAVNLQLSPDDMLNAKDNKNNDNEEKDDNNNDSSESLTSVNQTLGSLNTTNAIENHSPSPQLTEALTVSNNDSVTTTPQTPARQLHRMYREKNIPARFRGGHKYRPSQHYPHYHQDNV
ncbi:myb-like protein X [Musca domestica]|uniref:Myb-like protein X n=1 Tax=Musca domestica TaxID=7370 RepID=A0A1I8MEY9_MUSDO|nr:myb-like protein X [Musca domestica]